MVSQCTGQQESPVDSWKGFSNDSGDVDGFSSLLNFYQLCNQSDVKLSKHKAAWINPEYAQQELTDSPALVPAETNRRSSFVGDTIIPLFPVGNTSTEASISKDNVNSTDSPLVIGTGENCSEISLMLMKERLELPPHSSKMPVSKILSSSPHPKMRSTFHQLSHWTASPDTDPNGGDEDSSLQLYGWCLVSGMRSTLSDFFLFGNAETAF
ncbi:protein associated with UVRAG as autophagy enhancer-like [Sorex fumeus]|uniref:protein associated with UVRAG as autophagy enhancer-like n=1 Tax=Sorex fumeus TaxID=62283 RepID=UPI0024AE6AD0|nr:protein associated with UVRAG as autophagy enhancer-like [Sorex fumeus]